MKSEYNYKRATAAKCRESHHRRTDASTAVPFPDSGGVTHGILQRGALMIVRTVLEAVFK
jgi:hypothetical protein